MMLHWQNLLESNSPCRMLRSVLHEDCIGGGTLLQDCLSRLLGETSGHWVLLALMHLGLGSGEAWALQKLEIQKLLQLGA